MLVNMLKVNKTYKKISDQKNYYIVSEIVYGGELFKRLQLLESFTED